MEPTVDGQPQVADGGSVAVELLLLTPSQQSVSLLTPTAGVPAPTVVIDVPVGVDPVQLAHTEARSSFGECRVVHSTSWRFEHGVTLLTFVVVAEETAAGDWSKVIVEPYRLDPGGDFAQVTSHAVRHLAHLQRTGEVLDDDEWRRALARYPTGLAGEVTDLIGAPVTAEITCAYTVASDDGAERAVSTRRVDSPHDTERWSSRVFFDVARPRVTAERRSAEYVDQLHPVAEYVVEAASLTVNTYVHLPRVALVRVAVSAASIDGIVQVVKDLYDPETDVTFDGSLIGEVIGGSGRVAGRHRGVVCHLTSPVPSSDDPAVQAIAMQLLAKDLAIDFDATRSSLEAPVDLNSPIGAEVWNWAESTLIWRLPPRLAGWYGDIEVNTALGVSLRQLCDDAAQAVHDEDVIDDLALEERIRLLGALRTSFNRASSGEIDGYLVRCGLQQRAHLEAFLRHSGAAQARERVEAMFDQHIGALQLEQQLRARAGARDLGSVVRVFAAVTIGMTALSVGQAAAAPDGSGRFGSAVAAGAVILMVTTVVGVLIAVAARVQVGRWRSGGWAVAALAVIGGAVVLIADAQSSFGGSTWTTWLGVALAISGSAGVALLARLSDRT